LRTEKYNKWNKMFNEWIQEQLRWKWNSELEDRSLEINQSGQTTERKREKIQINKIRDEKEDIIMHTNEIKSIFRDSFENFYSNWKI
jgi:sugar-specific transcriptional regulator TrmB